MSSHDVLSINSNNRDELTIQPRLGTNSPTLSYFCVYNPILGQSEDNTKDQILYYTSKKVVSTDVKLKQVGLAQALVNFTSTFSPSHPTQNVHSQKNRMIFLQPEPGFWMHMCIELGISRKQIKDDKGKEKLVTEYLDSQLNSEALEAVLKVGYEQFKLLNGTFTSVLYGDENPPTNPPNRQRTRSLMHAIEEFFSDWIWKWDFDRLDTMCFNAVFNGVPIQPVLRTHYLRVHQLDTQIQQQFNTLISHLFILNTSDNSNNLVYRSPNLDIADVCALRKLVLKKVEKHTHWQKRKQDIESTEKKEGDTSGTSAAVSKAMSSGLKQFTKSLSNTHILSYFTGSPSKSTETTKSSATTATFSSLNAAAVGEEEASFNVTSSPVDVLPTSSSLPSLEELSLSRTEGIYLSGLIESMAIGMNGEERAVTKTDLIKVFMISNQGNGPVTQDNLLEYYLLIYKHKSDLVWNFLLPATPEGQDLLSDPIFYSRLEAYMLDNKLSELTDIVLGNINNTQEKNLNLGKHYKCFYYDNTTLNIKSTMIDTINNKRKDKKEPHSIQVTNEMVLQLLDVRQDFEKIPRTSEIYTRSTANHWIAGHRVHNTLRFTEEEQDNASDEHNKSFVDEYASTATVAVEKDEDYTEMYLIAAKKDISLADVEETLNKMTKNLLDTMHIE